MDLLALLLCGFLFGLTLAFGIGANDVANTFGTAVGSGAIKMKYAFAFASICETFGAVFLGSGVSDKISKGIVDLEFFEGNHDVLMLGYLSALVAGTIWLIGATLLKLPVSGTQCSVGAMMGMAIVVFGFETVDVAEIVKIALSWVISPVLSGVVSSAMFMLLKSTVLMNKSAKVQLNRQMKMLPIFFFITFAINIFACLFQRPRIIQLEFEWPFYVSIILAIFGGTIAAFVVYAVYAPSLKKKVQKFMNQPAEELGEEMKEKESVNPVQAIDDAEGQDSDKDLSCFTKMQRTTEWPGLFPTFYLLQIIISCFGSIAHGGNDVANAVAPITGMYEIYRTKDIPQDGTSTELWILFLGGIGITAGLWALGHKVIATVGEKLAAITPPRSFVIELGTAVTVLMANQIGLPISTTFCKVGSVVFVGIINGNNEVSWKLLFNVVMAWVFTVPASGLISAGVMAALMAIFHPESLSHISTPNSTNDTANVTTTLIYFLVYN